MDKIDTVFKVCFHATISEPDYSKPLASKLVGYVDTFFYQCMGPGNNPIILLHLLPNLNLVINFSLENKKEIKKILELLGFSLGNEKAHCRAVKSILE